jgi:thioredoxin
MIYRLSPTLVFCTMALTISTLFITTAYAAKGCGSCSKKSACTPNKTGSQAASSKSAISMSTPHPVTVATEAEFQMLLDKNMYVVAKFSATWCGPCKAFAPTFESVAKETDKVAFAEIDVDAAQALSSKYAIQSMPTTLFFKNGKEIHRLIGGKNAHDLKKLLREQFGQDIV